MNSNRTSQNVQSFVPQHGSLCTRPIYNILIHRSTFPHFFFRSEIVLRHANQYNYTHLYNLSTTSTKNRSECRPSPRYSAEGPPCAAMPPGRHGGKLFFFFFLLFFRKLPFASGIPVHMHAQHICRVARRIE